MEAFFSAVANFGFPVVVASYLLFTYQNKLEKMNLAIVKLTEAISGKDGLTDRLEDIERALCNK